MTTITSSAIAETHPTAILPRMSEANVVYFAREDYASFFRRITSFLIDLVVLFLLLSAVTFLIQLMVVPSNTLWMKPPKEVESMPSSPEKTHLLKKFMAERQHQIDVYMKPVAIQLPANLCIFVLIITYHVGLRMLPGGTLGYRLTGIRLINEKREPPSRRALIKRFLIGIPSTMFLLFGYLSCWGTPRRQALHDQLCGTWVIRSKARPAGPATLSFHPKMLALFIITLVDLEPLPVGVDVASPELG